MLAGTALKIVIDLIHDIEDDDLASIRDAFDEIDDEEIQARTFHGIEILNLAYHQCKIEQTLILGGEEGFEDEDDD